MVANHTTTVTYDELLRLATDVTYDRSKYTALGIEAPSEDELVSMCSACDETGWYSVRRWPDGAVDSGRCRHWTAHRLVLMEHFEVPMQEVA